MKKTALSLFIALGLLTVTTAHGSKARLLSFAQSEDGSLFIPDARNIFLNPATIFNAKQSVNFELGNQTVNDGMPDAEGGLLMATSPIAYAVQLGRTGASTDEMIAENNLFGTSFYFPQSAIDVVIGGTASVQWGAGFHMARSENKTGPAASFPDSEAKDIALSGGVIAGRASGYLRYDLIHDSSSETAPGVKVEYDGKLSLELGGKFDLDTVGDHAVGAKLKRRNYDFNNGLGTTAEVTRQELRADYFTKLVQRENTFLFGMAGLRHTSRTANYPAGSQDDKTDTLSLPITLGASGRALTWLTIRASVSQDFLIDRYKRTNGATDKEIFNEESTIVAVGTTAEIGEFNLDATLQGADDGSGRINASTLMANASLTYAF